MESWSLQLRNDTKMSPQLNSLFFIVTSIVYAIIQDDTILRTMDKDQNKMKEKKKKKEENQRYVLH